MLCKHCSTEIDDHDLFCKSCGKSTNESETYPSIAVPTKKPKSKIAAALFAFTLGYLGIHNYYLGYKNKANIQLILFVLSILLMCGTLGLSLLITPILYIWAFVEGIMIISGSIPADADGVMLE